jgi:hypothetical protein
VNTTLGHSLRVCTFTRRAPDFARRANQLRAFREIQKSSPSRKKFSLSPSGKTSLEIRASRAPIEEGRIAIVTTRWARDAMDADGVRRDFWSRRTRTLSAYGEVVWS